MVRRPNSFGGEGSLGKLINLLIQHFACYFIPFYPEIMEPLTSKISE